MHTIDESQRTAARVAGLAYVLSFALVVATNFGIHDRLSVPGDAAETARRILTSESLFRVAVAADLVFVAGSVVLLTALYALLASVSRPLALLAAVWRFVYVLMWAFMALRGLDALRVLHAPDYLRTFEPAQLQAVARLYLSSRGDAYYGGLLFFALAATTVAYLFLRSGFIPRALALFGMVGSVWCVLCAIAYIVRPDFANVVNLWWFDTPMALFELATGGWLLFRGLPHAPEVRRDASPASAAADAPQRIEARLT
jgi:hypothetical protein